MTPAGYREAASHLQAAYEMSERRARRVLGVDRTSVRYQATRPDDGSLRDRLKALAQERRRFTSFLASDKPINGAGSGRTDLTVFNRQIAFRGDNAPSNPIIIFEFKRPKRDDFVGAGEDPFN